MGIATNVCRRNGSSSYYARISIPLDLIEAFNGKKERWKSLGTPNGKEAKRLARPVLDAWEREFALVRARQTLSEQDLQEAVWQRYVELTDADEAFRRSLPTDEDLDVVWVELEREFGPNEIDAWRIYEIIRDRYDDQIKENAKRSDSLRHESARGETRLVADEVRRVFRARGVDLPRTGDDYRRLAQGLQRAELEALLRSEERNQGNWAGEPRDKLIRPPTTGLTAAPGETVMDLFATYVAENPNGVKQNTLDQSRLAVEAFVSVCGARTPVGKIDKKAVRAWKALLMRYPVKATETAAFRGMSFKEIVAANEKIGKPKISSRTVNRYLSGLGAFCDWLVDHDWLDANPSQGMYIRLDKTKRAIKPFSSEELRTLFASPLFVGCASDEKMHVPGDHLIRDHRYWLPLVMLYSGARPAEIAQLLVDDVREMHGHWIMHITEEGDSTKSVKTKGSQRVVPVHLELERLGFLAYRRAMNERGQKRLFPDAERNVRGQMAAQFSREFGRYLQRIGLKEGRGLSLYSFRHGFVDALRRAEFFDEQFGILIGHTRHTTTAQYGVLPQGMLRQRVEMIGAVNYPGLDLSHLTV